MDTETLVTGGATGAVVLGTAVLLVGVEFGSFGLQGVGGAAVVAAVLVLAAYLTGLDEPAH